MFLHSFFLMHSVSQIIGPLFLFIVAEPDDESFLLNLTPLTHSKIRTVPNAGQNSEQFLNAEIKILHSLFNPKLVVAGVCWSPSQRS